MTKNQDSPHSPPPPTIHERFNNLAKAASKVCGPYQAFTAAVLIVILWATTGPLFHFSDTWQLVINTGTTIVTFLMVFLIQNTQNRDAKAIHLKLDELIRAIKGARNDLVLLEDMSDEELEELAKQFARLKTRNENREPALRAKREAEEVSRVSN